MKQPIFIVGAPRSGTTLLGRIFALHPEIAFWEEPRTIWEIGNAYGKSDDTLTEADATPEISAKIRSKFSQFLEKSGRSRFAEKTPVNVLRLRFIHATFPDCRIIFLTRDGPASVASSLKMQARPPRIDRLWQRFRETPISSLPALFLRGLNRRRFSLRPSGWQNFSDDPIQAAVQQWKAADAIARCDLEKLPADSILEISYEDFVRDPSNFLARIFDFCDLKNVKVDDSMIDPKRAEPEIPEAVKKAFHDPIGSVLQSNRVRS